MTSDHTGYILKNSKEGLASINASNMFEKDQVYEIFVFLPKNCMHFSFSVSSFHPFFCHPNHHPILPSFHSNHVFLYLPSFHSSMLPSFHSFCPFILFSPIVPFPPSSNPILLCSIHACQCHLFPSFHPFLPIVPSFSSNRSILFFQW